MSVRLVALDLDGTLVETRTLEIAPADAAAVRRVAERGVPVVLATARWPASARQFQTALGITGPLICHNGGLVLDAAGSVVVSHRIPGDVATRVVRALLARDLYPTIIVDDVIYSRPRADQRAGPVDVSRSFHRMELSLVDDLEAVVANGSMDIGAFGPGVAEALGALAAESLRVHRYYRDGIFTGVVMNHPLASKGIALETLCASLRIPLEDVLAIGDSEADIPMLRAAGLAVAPRDASPDVREIADWIAPPHGAGTVAAALATFVERGVAT